MIRIRMLATMAGPEMTAAAGSIVSVDADTAASLVGAGYAAYVDGDPKPAETAAKAPAETAKKAAPKRRKRAAPKGK